MVGARAPGTEEKWLFLKDAHRSWPGGRGGRPRALIPGQGKGSGKGWLGRKVGHPPTQLAWWTGGCPVGWGGYPPELAWWTGG